jgi:hypothetical protein
MNEIDSQLRGRSQSRHQARKYELSSSHQPRLDRCRDPHVHDAADEGEIHRYTSHSSERETQTFRSEQEEDDRGTGNPRDRRSQRCTRNPELRKTEVPVDQQIVESDVEHVYSPIDVHRSTGIARTPQTS